MDQLPQRTRQPNLLLVVDDDHGWDMAQESATAGSTQHNIERVLPTFTRLFREEGVTLNHFYVHPKCARLQAIIHVGALGLAWDAAE